jgi:hypothetical protein
VIGVIGFIPEFIISDEPAFLTIILFGLLAIRGITKLFKRNWLYFL